MKNLISLFIMLNAISSTAANAFVSHHGPCSNEEEQGGCSDHGGSETGPICECPAPKVQGLFQFNILQNASKPAELDDFSINSDGSLEWNCPTGSTTAIDVTEDAQGLRYVTMPMAGPQGGEEGEPSFTAKATVSYSGGGYTNFSVPSLELSIYTQKPSSENKYFATFYTSDGSSVQLYCFKSSAN
jgi:hypothetical protein